MAEELRRGSWAWSRNLFGSSSCSLASNLDTGLLVEANARSSDDSAGSGSDGGSRPPDDDWTSHDLLLPDGGSYSEDLNSGMDYQQQTRLNFFPEIQCLENCTAPGLSAGGFPQAASSLLQTLFDTNTDQMEQPNLLDRKALDYSANEFLPEDPPMFGKQQVPYHDWSTATAVLSDLHGSLIPQFQLLPSSPNINKQHNLPDFNTKHQSELASRDDSSSAMKKASCNDQPIVKRPRIETPSPLPTFKVRKEKLGDRITALQQLVSPFGKTDTASVLHEAIEYIKFLHDQVSVLCAPYLKKGSLQLLLQHQKDPDDPINDQQGQIQGLRNGGLCLVPISTTFAIYG